MSEIPEYKLDPSKNEDMGENILNQLAKILTSKVKKVVWYALFPVFLFGFFAGAWIF